MAVRIHPATGSDHTKTAEGTDSRRDARAVFEAAEVRVHLAGREQPVAAMVVEVSNSGLQPLADEPLPVGTQVCIDMDGLVVQRDVRHCRPRLDSRSYTVGILMRDVTESDRGNRGHPRTARRGRRRDSPRRSKETPKR